MRIPGPVLLGFGDFFANVNLDPDTQVMGATKSPVKPAGKSPAKPKPTKPAPAGSTANTLAQATTVPKKKGVDKSASPHKAALTGSLAAAKKAATTAEAAGAKAKNYFAAVKAGKHGPVVPLAAKGKTARGTVVLGIVASPSKPNKPLKLTPKQQAAVKKHVGTLAKTAAAAKRTAALAVKADAAGKKAAAFVKDAAPYLKAALAGKSKGKTAIHGEVVELLGLVDELLGTDAYGLEPGQPGYDPTTDMGTPVTTPFDPNAVPAAPATGTGSVVTAPDGSVLYDPAQDPMVVPMPERGGTLTPDEAQESWTQPPADAIVYDGSKGWPRYSKGSVLYFFGPQTPSGGQFGLVWGYDHMNMPASTETRWIKRFGQAAVTNNDNWDDGFQNDAEAAAATAAGDSRNLNPGSIYGPLIGNPKGPLAGLQYATGTDQWFWKGKNAPKWASAEADNKIAEANKATIAANTAAAQAQAASMAQDIAAAAQAQAQAEAANALAESNEASAAAIAQSQQATQQGQMDLDSQRTDATAYALQVQNDAAERQANLEYAKSMAANQAAAQHALIDQASVWNTWAQSHPDEAAAELNASDSVEVDDAGDVSEDAASAVEPDSFDDGGQRIEPDTDVEEDDYDDGMRPGELYPE